MSLSKKKWFPSKKRVREREKVSSLARSVSKPLKVPSLARSVPKPLKVPSLACSVPKPLYPQFSIIYREADKIETPPTPPTPHVPRTLRDNNNLIQYKKLNTLWIRAVIRGFNSERTRRFNLIKVFISIVPTNLCAFFFIFSTF